ncbi:3-oxoacyl-ACP synthase [Phytomonospora sp. NPDC050363]|uniref:3-oxoacyl-ACP synthase III family protein n=1 Tax=Phytomonospora sp. NPDC050363 TaxID=3155642 RepID=UPI0033C09AFD
MPDAKPSHSRIESLGCVLPPTVVTNAELLAGTPVPAGVVEKVTGVKTRRMCDPSLGEDSHSLAVAAAADCLSRSRYAAADLDVVVSASITRIRAGRLTFEPSFAAGIAREIGATAALTFDVGNACAGTMTGILLLDRLIRAGKAGRGLVVSGEQATAISRTAARELRQARDPRFASLTVGDSGVAVLVDGSADPADRIHDVHLQTSAGYSGLCLALPSDQGPGIAMYTDTRGQQHPERMEGGARFIADTFARSGRAWADARHERLIQHQISASAVDRMNRLAARVSGEAAPPSPTVLAELGNTATTSHFVVLHDQLERGEHPLGGPFLMVVAASGIVSGFLSATVSSVKV